MTFPGG